MKKMYMALAEFFCMKTKIKIVGTKTLEDRKFIKKHIIKKVILAFLLWGIQQKMENKMEFIGE